MAEQNFDIKNPPKDLFVPLKRDEDTSERISRPSRTFMQDAVRTLRKNKPAMISLFLLILIILMSIFGPYMNEYDYNGQEVSKAKLPPYVPGLEWMGLDGTLTEEFKGNDVQDAKRKAIIRFGGAEEFIDFKVIDEGDGSRNSAVIEAKFHIYDAKGLEGEYYWLGTDQLGRDQWTRLWLGTRVSLIIAFIAAFIDLLIGVTYGGISGYYGGRIDNVMQRILEVLVGIPTLVVVLLMMLFMKPGMLSIIIALTITGWTSMARIVRGEVMKLKNQEFVLASRTLGTPNGKIIRRHILPNISGIIIVNMMFTIPSAVFFEAFLSFIGMGITPPDASLGALINNGFDNLRIYPYMLVFPAALLSIIMICFNILGDGLRDAFDPKMHK